MGLGPKWEGAFTPPAPPSVPEVEDPAMQQYVRAMERYILQLHDQLNVTFEIAQTIINQTIVQGDGDGDFTISNDTEEGDIEIASVSPIWGPNFSDKYAWIVFPFPPSMYVGWTEDPVSHTSPANEVWTWPVWVPFRFYLKAMSVQGRNSTGGTEYCGAGIYTWGGTVISKGVASFPLGAEQISDVVGISAVVMEPGLYRMAQTPSTTTLVVNAHRVHTNRTAFSLCYDAMAEHSFGKSPTAAVAGVLPNALGTIVVNAHGNKQDVPIILLEGEPT